MGETLLPLDTWTKSAVCYKLFVCITLLHIHTMYTQCVLCRHIHECAQAIKLWCLARNIFLLVFENFAYQKQTCYLIRQLKNIKSMTLEDDAAKCEQNICKMNLLLLRFHIFPYFFP